LECNFHALGIGNEVGREIAAVELHAFDDFELGLQSLRVFAGDDAVFANLLHGLGNDLADGLVIVGGDGADLGNHFAGDWLRQFVEFAVNAVAFFVEFAGDDGDGFLDATLQGHGIGAGGNGLDAFAVDGLGKDCGGRGSVAGDVGRL